MIEYLETYIVFNRWYRKVTSCRQDAGAIRALQRRYVIWKDYIDGQCLSELVAVHENLIGNKHAWQALIRRWYDVRCRLVHGETVRSNEVRSCNESLRLFMAEIVRRHELVLALERFRRRVYAPEEWAVDMIPAKTLEKLFTN